VWSDMVMDIKTGAAPTKKQLEEGMIPQLPIEGYILQNGGFGFKSTDKVPILQFLQFQNKHLKLVSYTDVVAQTMIDNSVQKIKELFGQYCSQPTAYEYRVTTGKKYHAWDDLARIED